jgi:beta-glucosidase
MTIAASWDVDIASRWAIAMAEEFAGKGANMALGPGIGIARVPTAGRNFEYLCGEDPILGAKLVQPVVKGFQENGIMANAKHYINNEIETERMEVSANVDERTRFELYYPPFQAAVEAGVLSIMCSYNRINGIYACENPETLAHLRDIMGFEGWVISDWGAVHSTTPSIRAGLDVEMPYAYFYSPENLTFAMNDQSINMNDIDTSVARILSAMDALHWLDDTNKNNKKSAVKDDSLITKNVTSDAHNQLAREFASQSTVLVKNENHLLPLNINSLGECIAVIGDETIVSGDGSGSVVPPYIITTVQGIQNVIDAHATSPMLKIEVRYHDGKDIDSAVILAKQCSYTIVKASAYSTEGIDRSTLSLGDSQDQLISQIAIANPGNVVVVLNIPGAVLMPWIDQVHAVVIPFLPGQEAGNALADILFGKVNPSGRLPITIPNKDNEIAFTPEQYPGTGTPPQASYSEQLYIGYRWYDANNITPVFPFGHGLSYTQFSYSNLEVKTLVDLTTKNKFFLKDLMNMLTIQFSIQNIGSINGAEVPQLYLSYPINAQEPIRQLRAFSKIQVNAGTNESVTFSLTNRDIAIWNSNYHKWEMVPGMYTIYIGASSRDLRLEGQFTL